MTIMLQLRSVTGSRVTTREVSRGHMVQIYSDADVQQSAV